MNKLMQDIVNDVTFNRRLIVSMGALLLTLTVWSGVTTPTIKLHPPAYETTGCVGHPKYRPDINWRVISIGNGKVQFENGHNLYTNAVVLKGNC